LIRKNGGCGCTKPEREKEKGVLKHAFIDGAGGEKHKKRRIYVWEKGFD
jgi:hypothetical protein